jgi:hypothetical protein
MVSQECCSHTANKLSQQAAINARYSATFCPAISAQAEVAIMDVDTRLKHCLLSAEREKAAANRASNQEVALIHHRLAAMHRHEAAKIEGVKAALQVAFGE